MAVVVYSREHPVGFLFNLIEVESWNYKAVAKVIEDTVEALQIDPKEFKRLMTDSGGQMHKGLRKFQEEHPECPNLKVHPCGAHKLNNVVGKVFETFKFMHEFYVHFRKLLKNRFQLQAQLKNELKITRIPPAPSTTRWESSVDAMVFMANNWNGILSFLQAKINEKVIKNEQLIQWLQDPTFLNQMNVSFQFFSIHFRPVNIYFKKLQDNLTSFAEAKQLMRNVEDMVKRAVQNSAGTFLQAGLQTVLEYTSDIVNDWIEKTDELDPGLDYVGSPVSNCDTERAFSLLTTIVTFNRSRLTFKNIRNILLHRYFLKSIPYE